MKNLYDQLSSEKVWVISAVLGKATKETFSGTRVFVIVVHVSFDSVLEPWANYLGECRHVDHPNRHDCLKRRRARVSNVSFGERGT